MVTHESSEPELVLVVDDDDAIVDLLTTALRFTGYEVISAQSGFDALRCVRSDRPDLIVLDVNLPELDGFEVCRRIRRDGIQTPVIFLTARDDADALRSGFRHGGDDYLTKPFSLEELALRVEAVLKRAGVTSRGGTRLVVDDLVLDEQAHQVTIGGDEVSLSPTEFRLLRYLMANSGHVLGREQILNQVWDYDFDGDAQIVETYISYLRRKLGNGGSAIRTVRGVGYAIRSTQ
jgi:two-component system, OmpR family, response regulator